MSEEHVTHAEFEQYEKRMEDWKKGVEADFRDQLSNLQSLKAELKEEVKEIRNNMMQIQSISEQTKEIGANVTHIKAEQTAQGAKLEKIEGRDGDLWRKVLVAGLTAIVGLIAGYMLKGGF